MSSISSKQDSAARNERRLRARRIVEENLGRRSSGDAFTDNELIAAHPDLREELPSALAAAALIARAREAASGSEAEITWSISPDPGSTHVPPDELPGYRLIREIHRGGQGVVYEAVQESTHRSVAVKVLLEGPFADEPSRLRFEREVQLVARLKHPNIVVVHDSGVAAGRHFLVMDLVEGSQLSRFVRDHGLRPRQVVELVASACEAVSYAHQHGVIHRDLKPSNILVSSEGRPCVLDFGLAKIISDHQNEVPDPTLTHPGHLLGTIRYMAPEQTRGNSEEVDARSDIYAMGLILFELLTGRAAYETVGDLTVAIRNIREQDAPRPSALTGRRSVSGIDSDLDAVVLKALEKEQRRRYQSMSEFVQDLRAWLGGDPVQARSASSLYVLSRIARRHRYTATVAGLLLVITTTLSLICLWFYLGGREALAARTETEGRYAAAASLFEQAGGDARDAIHRNALGWFLAEWRTGNEPRAREIRDRMPAGAPERMVMSYLLGDGPAADQLLAAMPSGARALADFALAEEDFRVGDAAAARDHLQACIEAGPSDWLLESATSRLALLDDSVSPGAAGQGEK